MSARRLPLLPPSEELQALLKRVRKAVTPADYAILERLVQFVQSVLRILAFGKVTILRLKRLLEGFQTEALRSLFPVPPTPSLENPPESSATPSGPPDASSTKDQQENEKAPPKGHGRRPTTGYSASRVTRVRHPHLEHGSLCPACKGANVSLLKDPARTVRILGQALLVAHLWEADRLRCNTCGDVFTAPFPAEALGPKFDEAARVMIALFQYGNGFPGYRLARFQKELGVPVPESVQWELNEQTATDLRPITDEMFRQAAQAGLIHTDDTGVKILDVAKAQAAVKNSGKKTRKGLFTTSIVAAFKGHSIALFFTGRKHAGENLAQLLAQRQTDLPPPIQECDALNRNYPKGFRTIIANCLAHGRRKVVDAAPVFPAECKRILDDLAAVFHHDDLTKKDGLSPEARLQYHQAKSAPILEGLHQWMIGELKERKIEPNSALGRAIRYLLDHWKKLTLFLETPGVPLDNNICERALKMAILRRKNSLFYKTEAGAAVGDALMSVIQTCRLCETNPFDYLVALLKNRDAVKFNPAAWMPWNYAATPVAQAASG